MECNRGNMKHVLCMLMEISVIVVVSMDGDINPYRKGIISPEDNDEC